ncbi:Uncharacterised protein [Mycobacteroides abscessus subsp. abscessus]|nr:Uncharacterised protein [Mycobacteroides abscessus subsp. abscessus]
MGFPRAPVQPGAVSAGFVSLISAISLGFLGSMPLARSIASLASRSACLLRSRGIHL